MIKLLFRSLVKSWRLKRISKKLSARVNPAEIGKLIELQKDVDKALDDLLSLCRSDDSVSYVIHQYSIDNAKLKKIYHKLLSAGAGRYAGGHYVAASSLVYAWALKFLLDHFDGDNFSIKNLGPQNSALFISDRMTQYFGKGESGQIE